MQRPTLLARRARPLVLAGIVAVLRAGSAVEAAAAVVPSCVPIPDEGPRDSDAYRDPEPDASLVQAVARLQTQDPHATVRFSDCEVDSFATRAKDTVPTYASRILRAAGLSIAPAKVELYPLPTLEPKPGRLDGSLLLHHKLPLAEEAPLPTVPAGKEPTDGAAGDPRPGSPLLEERTEPPIAIQGTEPKAHRAT